MMQKKHIVITFIAVMILPAFDTCFKFFYGRSFLIERTSLTLNIGILSVVLLAFTAIYGMIYFAQKRKWTNFAKILCAIIFGWSISWLVGAPIKKQDRIFADSIVKNLSQENVLFVDASLRNGWELESLKEYELLGESPFNNVFIYKVTGNRSYLISIYLRPHKEVQVSSFGS